MLAFATNVPELMVFIIALTKGQAALGLGGVLGSNVINITVGLGIASFFAPLDIAPKLLTSILMLVAFSAAVYILHKSGRELTKVEAWLLIVGYIIIKAILSIA